MNSTVKRNQWNHLIKSEKYKIRVSGRALTTRSFVPQGFCGTVTDFKFRSVIRELGKVYGLPKEELDCLSRTDYEFQEKHEITRNIHRFGRVLEGFPNQYSMHSCGVFLSEQLIACYSEMNVYQKGVLTCEIDMYIAESIHLEKLDILSQRGLGHIKDAVGLVRVNKGESIDISNTEAFKRDPACNEMLVKGNTLGCFYIESPAMHDRFKHSLMKIGRRK